MPVRWLSVRSVATVTACVGSPYTWQVGALVYVESVRMRWEKRDKKKERAKRRMSNGKGVKRIWQMIVERAEALRRR